MWTKSEQKNNEECECTKEKHKRKDNRNVFGNPGYLSSVFPPVPGVVFYVFLGTTVVSTSLVGYIQ